MKKQIMCLALILSAAFCVASSNTYTFNPNQNHAVSLEEASALTHNFRTAHPTISVVSFAFGKAAINTVIGQTGCQGIRIYKGIDNNGNETLVIVGVDNMGNDMYTGALEDRSLSCTPVGNCSEANPLNTD